MIRKLMIKSVGERDMGMQEVMHQILVLRLYQSTFQVINISLDISKRCNLSRNNIKVDESDLEHYANRLKHDKEFQSMNLVEYFSKYHDKTSKLSQRMKPVVVRTFPQYLSNPNSETYGLHCKFQFIKYKPWNTCPQDAWNHLDESDIAYVTEWKNFLETDIGNKLVLNWKRSLYDTFIFVSCDELGEDEETVNESQQCEEWMYIARMVGPPQGNHLVEKIESEIQEMRSTFTNEQIASMASWLHNEKKNHICNSNVTTPTDIAQLNDKQRFVYEIVVHHVNSSEKEQIYSNY